jgi:putative ABC transport system permease protein
LQVVLKQALFYAGIGFVPAFLVSLGLYAVISEIALIPMCMSAAIGLGSLGLTVAMCLASGLLAVRRVMSADPAEIF